MLSPPADIHRLSESAEGVGEEEEEGGWPQRPKVQMPCVSRAYGLRALTPRLAATAAMDKPPRLR